MKHTLGTSEAISALLGGKNASWTRDGAAAIVDHLENMEDELGEAIEFDRVGIRCEWTEYDSDADAAAECMSQEELEEMVLGGEYDADAIIEWFQDRTTVLYGLDNGHFIVQDF